MIRLAKRPKRHLADDGRQVFFSWPVICGVPAGLQTGFQIVLPGDCPNDARKHGGTCGKLMPLNIDDPRSFNGGTPGLGLRDRGSNP